MWVITMNQRYINGLTYSKIVTVGPIRKQRNLTFGQLGIVRKFKGG